MPKAEVTLPAAVNSVPTARHFVESILSGWGLQDLAWTATLIISELSANAALHARGEQFSIRISTEGEGVRLEVDDNSLRLPQQRSYSNDATTGRGLRLVSELAHEWGVTPREHGKTVWAVLQADAGSADDDEEVDVDALLSAFSDDDVIPLDDHRERPGASATQHLADAA
ncbi:MAG: fixL 1 [Frankiales bacterium]|jgi:anti-sigma regulatory factor (Ser/Thr protein kinase)|nr:fixL 1 [Frankiales bacterium]